MLHPKSSATDAGRCSVTGHPRDLGGSFEMPFVGDEPNDSTVDMSDQPSAVRTAWAHSALRFP